MRAILLDKTGTITTGKAVLREVRPLRGFTEDEVLATACALERASSHPLAEAVLGRCRARGIEAPEARDVRNSLRLLFFRENRL